MQTVFFHAVHSATCRLKQSTDTVYAIMCQPLCTQPHPIFRSALRAGEFSGRERTTISSNSSCPLWGYRMKIHTKNAYEYALKVLTYANKSESLLIKRLRQKSFDETDIRQAVAKLKKYGFINDDRIAADLIITMKMRGLSNRMIFFNLLQKGFPRDIIQK
ncbi:MAG: hypothetical protein GF384_03980, partial [Elusimicrobia bacterium]|nr:hypothetical protein [Elusimicrobiota bacterium]MBD3412049.1 hypothetical protein [Elusimicrobiota bacterium]